MFTYGLCIIQNVSFIENVDMTELYYVWTFQKRFGDRSEFYIRTCAKSQDQEKQKQGKFIIMLLMGALNRIEIIGKHNTKKFIGKTVHVRRDILGRVYFTER